MAPFLEVKNLTHIYSAGTPFEHTALEDVSFSLDRGEFIGVIGHTGSGKSTLMQHLNGLLKPDSGCVQLDGIDIWQDKKITSSQLKTAINNNYKKAKVSSFSYVFYLENYDGDTYIAIKWK